MDLPMLGAASLFAGTAAYGGIVGAREDIAGEPFGWRLPGRVAVQEAWGYGSGTMAPWPMPVAALVAAARAGQGSDLPARVCLAIGSVCLVGTVVEPHTWGRRSASAAATLATALHLLSGTALVLAGRRAVLAHRRAAQGLPARGPSRMRRTSAPDKGRRRPADRAHAAQAWRSPRPARGSGAPPLGAVGRAGSR